MNSPLFSSLLSNSRKQRQSNWSLALPRSRQLPSCVTAYPPRPRRSVFLLLKSYFLIGSQRSEIRLLLFVFGDDAAAAMRTLPVALLEVSARVSDLFTTVLARHRDVLIFRHVARITETCLECILGSAEGEKQCARAQLSVNG